MPAEERRDDNYAGRWVARVRGRIIAQAGTPEGAMRAALKSRPKEKPEIIYMSSHPPFSPWLDTIRSIAPEAELYLVGGAVRDALLGRVSHDLDFSVPKQAIALARRIAAGLQADFYILDEAFDAARVLWSTPDGGREVLDFSAARGPDLESDLRGRDFTVNAIAFDVRSQAILDPLNGAADLRAKVIRACSAASFDDDAVRILRAVRMAAAFDFKIEAGTRAAMKAAVARLPGISPERKRDELFKMLEGRKPEASMRALEMLGVLPQLLPELAALKGVEQPAPHVYDVWEHTLSVLGHLDGILAGLAPGYDPETTNEIFTGLLTVRLGRFREQLAAHFETRLNADRSLRALLFFAALYHDAAKPGTKSLDDDGRMRFFDHDQLGAQAAAERARSFNLSNDEVQRLEAIIANHMRFHFHTSRQEGDMQEPSRKAIYRFFRDAGEAGVDLVLLGLADLRGTRGPTLTQATWAAALDVARIFLENFWEKPEETVAPPRLVDGNDLIREFSLEEGPLIGRLLEALREAQAVGKVADRRAALEFSREWLKENRE